MPISKLNPQKISKFFKPELEKAMKTGCCQQVASADNLNCERKAAGDQLPVAIGFRKVSYDWYWQQQRSGRKYRSQSVAFINNFTVVQCDLFNHKERPQKKTFYFIIPKWINKLHRIKKKTKICFAEKCNNLLEQRLFRIYKQTSKSSYIKNKKIFFSRKSHKSLQLFTRDIAENKQLSVSSAQSGYESSLQICFPQVPCNNFPKCTFLQQ